MISTPCVLFAGGKSSRMGEDKSLLPFGGFATLTEFQHSRLSKIFSHVYISCKDREKFDWNADFIEDRKDSSTYAPTLGFISAFEHLKESFFALSVDSPFVDEQIISTLLHADREDNDATIAQTPEGIQPLCGIYHPSLIPAFEDMLANEQHKLGLLLKNSKTHFVAFPQNEKFLNLNHPHEYQKALQMVNSTSL